MGYHEGYLHELWIFGTDDVFTRVNGWIARWPDEWARNVECLTGFDAEFGHFPNSAAAPRRVIWSEPAVGKIANFEARTAITTARPVARGIPAAVTATAPAKLPRSELRKHSIGTDPLGWKHGSEQWTGAGGYVQAGI
jgi:hypothetical protein